VNTPCYPTTAQDRVAFISYQSVNPANGKFLKKFKDIMNKQLETSLKTASTGFDTWSAADLPFGGIKNSCDGRELSSPGIQNFENRKQVRASSIDAPA